MDFKYKFSVIVPCYNSEKFLKETLDSLLGQTLKEIQIITINDGSTDSTAEILDEYAAKDSRILSIYQENAGVSAARNNGIKNADGKYIAFLDSDDVYSENALESMYNVLEKTGSDMGICRIMRFGYGGNEYNPIADSLASESEIDVLDKRLIWSFLLGNKCFRTALLKESEVLFPSLRYSEDAAFIMPFIYKARPKITGIFDAVMKYRRMSPEQGFSVSQRIENELVEHFSRSHDLVCEAAKLSFSKNDDDDYIQEILQKKYTALINEFYRLLWRGDDETLALIGSIASEIKAKMTEDTQKKCSNVIKDIGEPVFSKEEIAKNPFVSVIAKNPSKNFVRSLYAQTMPSFELITTNGIAGNYPNAVIFSDEHFISSAKKAAKGKIIITVSGDEILDMRFLKVVSLLKRSNKFGIFPDFLIKIGADIFLKIKK